MDQWVNEVTKLADSAISETQASYATFTFLVWSSAPLDKYFSIRTLPDISELLEPLELAINEVSYQLSLTIQSLKQSASSLVTPCAWEALDLQIL